MKELKYTVVRASVVGCRLKSYLLTAKWQENSYVNKAPRPTARRDDALIRRKQPNLTNHVRDLHPAFDRQYDSAIMEHSLCLPSCAWRSESNRQRNYVNILPRQNTRRDDALIRRKQPNLTNHVRDLHPAFDRQYDSATLEHSLCLPSCAWRSESNRQRNYVNILPRQNTDRCNFTMEEPASRFIQALAGG
jgi:hypothetical protein